MSETLRSYTGKGKTFRQQWRPRKGLGPGFRLFLAAALLLVIYVLWTTRDARHMEEFIPAGQRLQLVASEVLEKRDKMAASRIWEALPEAVDTEGVLKLLNQELSLPEWIVNNLIGAQCHFSGNELQGLDDALFVTRMTPVGTLLERLQFLFPGIESDKAGGLHVRKLVGAGLYYAVRGRILIASPSRRALINALTLAEEEQSEPGAVAAALAAAGSEDVSGTIRLDGDEALGQVFHSISFAVQLEPDRGSLKFRGAFRPEWERRLSAVMDKPPPQRLARPLDGPVMISIDAGLTVKELWAMLGEVFTDLPISEMQWLEWEEAGEEGTAARVLTALLGPAGPAMRATWRGMDLNEMVPVPELLVLLEDDGNTLSRAMEILPQPPQGPAFIDPYPYYDAETNRVSVPTIGGPSMETTLGRMGSALLVSSSRSAAEAYLSAPSETVYLPDTGNIYVCIKPMACVDAVAGTGALLAENGLLKGHSPQSFERKVLEWQEKAARIREITGFATLGDGQLEGEFHVLCTGL